MKNLSANLDIRIKSDEVMFFFFTVVPQNASLSTNVSITPLIVVCAGVVVTFVCTVEATNPAM